MIDPESSVCMVKVTTVKRFWLKVGEITRIILLLKRFGPAEDKPVSSCGVVRADIRVDEILGTNVPMCVV